MLQIRWRSQGLIFSQTDRSSTWKAGVFGVLHDMQVWYAEEFIRAAVEGLTSGGLRVRFLVRVLGEKESSTVPINCPGSVSTSCATASSPVACNTDLAE